MLRNLAAWIRKAQERFACRQAHEGIHRQRHEPFPPALEALLQEGRSGGEEPGTMAAALARIDETLSFLDGIAPDALGKARLRRAHVRIPQVGPWIVQLPRSASFSGSFSATSSIRTFETGKKK